MTINQQRVGVAGIRHAIAIALRYELLSLPLTWAAIFFFFGLETDLRHLFVWDDVRWAAWTASYGTFLHEIPFLHLPLALIGIPIVGWLTKFNPVFMGLCAALCEFPPWLWVYGTWPGWPNLSVFFLVLGGIQGALLIRLVRREVRHPKQVDPGN